MTVVVPPASGSLELVRLFVNTRDIEAGTDQLTTASELIDWLSEHFPLINIGLATPGDAAFAKKLRESLRETMAANHDRAPVPPNARTVLNEAAEFAQLAVELDRDGNWSLRPRATGVMAGLGSITAEVIRAMSTSEWSRLKVCANDSCQWAFYDHSRARTGRWCSMQICGNQAKQKHWRSRHASTGRSQLQVTESGVAGA